MNTINLSDVVYFYGNFLSYADALQAANKILPDGYAANSILQRVADSIQKVRRGEAAFERDGVAFPREDYRFPLLAALMYVAARERRLTVLDFGGSLGSTYFQNRKLLISTPPYTSIGTSSSNRTSSPTAKLTSPKSISTTQSTNAFNLKISTSSLPPVR